MNFSKKDLALISFLRQNSRVSLTNLSRKTKIPVSTLFDRLRAHEKGLIRKHTSIVNFDQLGFQARASILVQIDREEKHEFIDFMLKHPNINSAYKINNGFDYQIETIFRDLNELETFMDQMEDRFAITEKKVYYIIDELKKEQFMDNIDVVGTGAVA